MVEINGDYAASRSDFSANRPHREKRKIEQDPNFAVAINGFTKEPSPKKKERMIKLEEQRVREEKYRNKVCI
jgi:hypothetical protein